eukprot:scaffold46055_cov56-Cyclotella_meneghiniana.AAC.4
MRLGQTLLHFAFNTFTYQRDGPFSLDKKKTIDIATCPHPHSFQRRDIVDNPSALYLSMFDSSVIRGRKMSAVILWDIAYPALLQYAEEHGNVLVPFNYKTNDGILLGRWVYRQRIEYEDDNISKNRVQMLNTVAFIWEKSYEWLERYEELLQYKEEHGDTLVSQGYKANLPLGSWVAKQRIEYKANNLSFGRIEALNKIGFVWNPLEDQWWDLYEQLLQYKKEHGDTLVPHEYESNPSLGKWVSEQRWRYKAINLSDERTDALNAIEFVWDTLEDQWLERYEELFQYKKEYGNTLVPRHYGANPSLASWVNTQRKRTGNLSNERVNALNAIGFVWECQNDSWSKRFQELLEYKKEHNNTLVPQKYKKYLALSAWVYAQRKAYRHNKLSEDRKQKLDEIEFLWDPIEDLWMKRFGELLQYKEEYGSTCVPPGYKENTSLGTWVRRQRLAYKRNKLSEDKIQNLNGIGFVWNYLQVEWFERFEELIKYNEEYGNTCVPRRYKKNRSLGRWVANQRQVYKHNKLSADRIQKLNEIGFVWNPQNPQVEWSERFEELIKYKEQHGNTRVPFRYKENPSLGAWVKRQRLAYKRNKMLEDRIQKLNCIGFIWYPRGLKK